MTVTITSSPNYKIGTVVTYTVEVNRWVGGPPESGSVPIGSYFIMTFPSDYDTLPSGVTSCSAVIIIFFY